MGYLAQGFDLNTQVRSFDPNSTALTSWRGVQSVQFSTDVPTTGIAPFSYAPRVFARGWGVDRPHEKLRIYHTFGDPGSTYRANRATGIWGTGADTFYGDCPAHVYAPTAADFDAATAQGQPPATELTYTHTIELEREDGESAAVTRIVTVLNPDHVFQGAATIIVDPDGDFTGAPTDPYGGTYGTATTIPSPMLDNTRYLIRRGKALTISTDLKVNSSTENSHVHLGGWGAGDRWQLLPTAENEKFLVNVQSQAATSSTVVEDMEIIGQWAGDEGIITEIIAGGVYVTGAGRITIHNCNLTGTNVGVRNTGQRNFLTFSNSRIFAFQNFGNLMSVSFIYACLGSVVDRHPDSFGGGAGSLGNRGGGPDHGPWRFSAPEADGRAIVHRTSAFSNAGWSMSAREASNILGEGKQPSHQAVSRTNTAGTEGWTYRASECVFEGGNAVLNFAANKNRVRNIDGLAESVVLMGTGNNGGTVLALAHMGIIVRNSVMIKPYVETFEKGNGKGAVEMVAIGDGGADYTLLRDEAYLGLYNNTFIDYSPMDTLETRKKDSVGIIDDEVFANNLVHAPNRPSTANDLTMVGSLLKLGVPIYKGLKWIDHYNVTVAGGDQPVLDTRTAVPDTFDQGGVITPNIAVIVPTAAIPIAQSRGVTIPFYDFFRNFRPRDGSASKGAVEPGSSLPGAATLISQPTPAAGSADFDGAVDSGWTTVAPAGFDGFSVVDGRLRMAYDPEESIDPGTVNNTAGLAAPRVERAITGDFDVYVKMDTDPMVPNAAFAGTGFVLRTASSSARMDIYVEDNQRQVRGYIKYGTTAGSFAPPSSPRDTSPAQDVGFPTHQRLTRIGDQITWRASFDGMTWVQMTVFTWAVEVTHVGVTTYQLSPAPKGVVFDFDYIHLDAQTPPVLADSVTRTTQAATLIDGSQVGGTATIAGDAVTLTCDTTNRSSGRVMSSEIFAENQGMAFTVVSTSAAAVDLYFGAVLRGQPLDGQDWAGQYAPPISLVFEGNHANDKVRMLRVGGPAPAEVDGANWTYLADENIPVADIDVATRIRIEAIGPFFRAKIWADGAAEPAAWDITVLDGAVRGAGKIGFSLSHNDGSPATGSVDITNVDVYEITA